MPGELRSLGLAAIDCDDPDPQQVTISFTIFPIDARVPDSALPKHHALIVDEEFLVLLGCHGVSSDDGSPSLDGRMKRRISEAEPEAGGDMKAPGIDLDSITVRGPQVHRRPAEAGQPANSHVFGKVKCHVGADIESDRRL